MRNPMEIKMMYGLSALREENKWKEEVSLKTNYFDLLNICGNLALSLKHPQNNGPSSIRAKEIGSQFANMIYNQFNGQLPVGLTKEWQDLGFIDTKKVH